MFISLYYCMLFKYQSLKILCLRSWQAGKTIISGDPFPCIHLLLFYFIGYVHCNMLWTLLELCIIVWGSILQPLTLYHCLQLYRLQTSKYDGQDTLCIHYLGNVIFSFMLEYSCACAAETVDDSSPFLLNAISVRKNKTLKLTWRIIVRT